MEWPASLSSELRSLKGDLDRPKEKTFLCRGQLSLGPSVTGEVLVVPVQLETRDSLHQDVFWKGLGRLCFQEF